MKGLKKMADYVSKYTGNEVDGILDEAIELPQASSDDNGKFLKYDSGSVIWDNPIDTSNASDGDVLKYNSNYGFTWDSLSEGLPVHNNGEFDSSILTINNYGDVAWYKAQTNANDGDFLKYSSDTGLYWNNPLDTSSANNGDFLKYTSNTGIVWDDPLNTSDAGDGNFLKYSSNTGIIWSNPIDPSSANSGDVLKYSSDSGVTWGGPIDITHANDGDFLKYSSDTGLYWNNPLDTSSANNGDFLKYTSNTGIVWDDPLNTSSAGNGEFLKYSSTTGIMWGSVGGTLPEYNGEGTALLTMACDSPHWLTLEELNIFPFHGSSDAGKVLTVLDNGALGWVSPNQ